MVAGPGKYLVGLAFGLLVVFALFTFFGSSPATHLFGVPFLIAGIGLVYSNYWANRRWQSTNGKVCAIEPDEDGALVKYSYTSCGAEHFGSVSRAFKPEIGDNILLFVNQEDAKQHYVDSPFPVFIGFGFVFAGAIVLSQGLAP